MVNDLERLMAVQEIATLKARYFRCVDTKDWDTLVSLFTADIAWDFSAGETETVVEGKKPAGVGPTSFVEFARSVTDGTVTVHHGHMPEITVTGDATAEGTWAMVDRFWLPADSPVGEVEGFGHYHERYEKHNNRWQIASLSLTRLKTVDRHWPDQPSE
jgi:hypothetical protein